MSDLAKWHRIRGSEGSCAWSSGVFLKFIIIFFYQVALLFHVVLGLANYVAGPTFKTIWTQNESVEESDRLRKAAFPARREEIRELGPGAAVHRERGNWKMIERTVKT